MRYYYFGFLLAAISTFFFQTTLNERQPASYPNFSGSAELNPVAPTPRDLIAPTNSSNPFSMKNIEDTYKGFLANEVALSEQATASRTRLQYYINLRNSNPNINYYLNSSSQLLHAIQQEQNNLLRIEGLRQSNSMYAFQKINLLDLSIQVGLRPESKARILELKEYILHVNYVSSSNAFPSTYAASYTTYSNDALLEFTPQYATGTVNSSPQVPVSNDFIGPRLPEATSAPTDTTGTVAI
jgi:hypothetical protein